MGEATATKLDVVLFPWLAIGHMIPYLELAMRLAARGHAVTFLSTPRNVARLPPVPPPVVEGLPEGAESTADVPPEMNELIKKAADGLAPRSRRSSRTPSPAGGGRTGSSTTSATARSRGSPGSTGCRAPRS